MLCSYTIVRYGLPIYGTAKPMFIIQKFLTQMCDIVLLFSCRIRSSNVWGGKTYAHYSKIPYSDVRHYAPIQFWDTVIQYMRQQNLYSPFQIIATSGRIF